MKKKLFLNIFFSFVCISLQSQVGIKLNSETLPNGYTFPNSSAALDLYSSTKGFLIPRLNIASTTDTASPVANPKQGLIAFNNNTTNKGLYIFDVNDATATTTSQYNRAYTFLETTKLISAYINNDLNMLSTINPGYSNGFSCKTQQDGSHEANPSSWNTILGLDAGYIYNTKIATMYLNTYGDVSGVVIPPGVYNIEVNYNFNASSGSTTTRSTAIGSTPTSGTNNDYYDMGYFNDLMGASYDATSSSSNPKDLTHFVRSETHSLSRRNQDHSAFFFYNLKVTVETLIFFRIGRVNGSTYLDQVTLKKAGTFIKFNKIQ